MNIQYNYVINGGFEQRLSPFDRGLSYGDGVFRTFRVLSSMPQDWDLHYSKLRDDCCALGIVCPAPELLLNDLTLLFGEHKSGVAKIIITRGEGERGYAPPAVTTPTRIVLRSFFPQYPSHYLTEGVNLYACITRLSHQPLLAGVKHLNRLENVLARAEWQSPDYVDGVMLDNIGNVIECTSANIFVRKGDMVFTPPLDQCGVSGVTRGRILEVLPKLSLCPAIKVLKIDDVTEADEMVICNSIYGAWQVRAYQQRIWTMGSLAYDLRRLLQV